LASPRQGGASAWPLRHLLLALAIAAALALELQRLALPEQVLAISTTGPPGRRADIDACRLDRSMSEQGSGGLGVFWLRLQIKRAAKVPELMRGHVDAEIAFDDPDDLHRDGSLILQPALGRDEQKAVHVGIEATQYVTTVPT